MTDTTRQQNQQHQQLQQRQPIVKHLAEMVPAAYSPLPYITAITHSWSFVGLAIGYHDVMVNGVASWTRFLPLRRTFLGGSILSGIAGEFFRGSMFNKTFQIQDAGARFPAFKFIRFYHIFSTLVLLFTEFMGPSYAQYALYSLLAQIATADLSRVWSLFYMGSHLIQANSKVDMLKD